MPVKIYCSIITVIILLGTHGCIRDEQPPGKRLPDYCSVTEIIATSKKCSCDIYFSDYINRYHFTFIESSFFSIGPPCNQKVMRIKYVNSVHDHNEPDYHFDFYFSLNDPAHFFRNDTFQVDSIGIGEVQRTGSHWAPYYDVDISFIWDTVAVDENVYTGSGRFLINQEIPHGSYSGYSYPAQEIPFEFCN